MLKPKACSERGSLYHSKWWHKPRKPLTSKKRMKPIGKKKVNDTTNSGMR